MHRPLLLRFAVVLPFVAACTDGPTPPTPPTPAVGLNDVSVLLPLPASGSASNVLRLDSLGHGGALLPMASFQAIKPFGSSGGSPYEDWRIVATRIDPCFPDLALLTTNPAACRRQLRLVAQPLSSLGGGGNALVQFDDKAIHLLYDLSQSDFTELARRWLALRTEMSSDPTRPLGVHPAIGMEGLDGPIATELRAIITAYAGVATLSQFTFVDGRGVTWDFGGFKVQNGELVAIPIHGLSSSESTTQTTVSNETGIFSITPASPESRGLEPLAGELVPDGAIGGGSVKLTATTTAIRAAMQLSLDIDNPTTELNADSLDCASCHVAARARGHATSLGASTAGLAQFTSEAFELTLDLADDVERSPQQQRAFGYNLDVPVWNQRVINESALVAARLGEIFAAD